MSIALPIETYERLEKSAREQNRSKNWIVNELLRRDLNLPS